MFHNSGINIFNIVDHGQSLAIDIKLLQRLVIFTINKYDLFFIFFLTLPSVDPVVFYILKILLRKHYCASYSYILKFLYFGMKLSFESLIYNIKRLIRWNLS